jgi:hypothetical protein
MDRVHTEAGHDENQRADSRSHGARERPAQPPGRGDLERRAARGGRGYDDGRVAIGRARAAEQLHELRVQRVARWIALGRILRETLENDVLDAARQGRVECAGPRRRLFDVLSRDLVPVLALERQHTGRCLEQRDPERVDVGPAVERLATGLLRGEVLRGAHHHVRARLLGIPGERARDSEVGHDRVAVIVVEDVVGFDVAVNDPFAMRKGERGRDIHPHANEQHFGEGPHDPEPIVEPGREKVHHEIDSGVLSAHRQNANDVRMAQLRRGRGLGAEARLECLFARILRLEDFDRDRDVELGVVALVNPGKAPRPDVRVDTEAAEMTTEIALRQLEPLQRSRRPLTYDDSTQ